ncbi:MAG: DUF1190 domain-containing protein [Bosea sp. (in: a-proteobacteria)]|jgi:uncharacterized protein YgiB involved in biofilm formation|uniref:DUF1190 domain-containing protein n=1 Tax=unclassified Bosea (in: a-proteobacteria) TaxID=2653178 RepID=UPI00083DE329|nr:MULTISPECIES: DUF1190 domain-containing protein [unclassified Bosea (in: a-proteobacteria)]MBA4267812.1 DUF1190 domain-containing protein [Methylobacterium sp.]MCZ8043806.1 DUF1190 domain-containing protein [Beijerinckiaceae bacterium]AOG05367.1 hypothetical protein BSY19_2918 [Bosea sp. RAC05]MDP3603359.1 DUF1190 domain-containing protein [Bosea sp. (in: a-proteobacteria)]WRH59279.1 MAG: DUF1190 domain-containing protein [Bosea sp. (in: a-proteobacteria)]
MKRSTQIGLAAAGILLVATYWGRSGSQQQSEESLVYANLAECRAGGQLTSTQCEQRFNEATANHLRDAKKFTSTSACETEYGSGSCRSAVWNGAQVVVPALAGFMLARSLAQGGGAAQPLLPPTQQACPPGSQAPECQQARSSSSGSSGGGYGGRGSSSSARAYSTTSGAALVARSGSSPGVATTTTTTSRGGFGSTARSYSSSSSS